MEYNTAQLHNGLRIIHLPNASKIVYCGFQIKAGTRNEQAGEEGLAHFCEHVTFKGTAHRNAFAIINSLEKLGGDLNAFTNKEDTVFYSAIPHEHFACAVDLLTDIVFRSTYPQSEIDKEVEVICDEIESYNDSPSELIYDDFENLLFKGHPLGHNILGTASRVRQLTTADALRFTRQYYRPDNAVFFCTYRPKDRLSPERIRKMLEKAFDKYKEPAHDLPIDTLPVTDSLAKQGSTLAPLTMTDGMGIRLLQTHQAHVMVGAKAFDFNDPRRTALSLLNNLLGGPGMNARLNIVLREHRGLVYTVESSLTAYSDTGVWCTYLGCDTKDIKRCLYLVRRELDRLCNQPLTETRLKAAKRQLKGQIGIACDNHENYALDTARYYLLKNHPYDIQAQYQAIDALTPQDLQQVAQQVFDKNRIFTLIYK